MLRACRQDLILFALAKEIKQHIVHMSEDIERAKTLLKKIMEVCFDEKTVTSSSLA